MSKGYILVIPRYNHRTAGDRNLHFGIENSIIQFAAVDGSLCRICRDFIATHRLTCFSILLRSTVSSTQRSGVGGYLDSVSELLEIWH